LILLVALSAAPFHAIHPAGRNFSNSARVSKIEETLMRKPIVATTFAAVILLLASATGGQESRSPQSAPRKQSGISGMSSSEMQREEKGNPDGARSAMSAMSGPMDMPGDMNAHMFMTTLRPKQPGDDERAAEIVETLRKAMGQYKDYRVALAQGYHIFGPNVPQKIYHFTNYWNGARAGFTFNPAKPTSLLYKKEDGTYVLVGAMFTAPRRFTEEQLNERVPLSVARWHKHVNLCLPPRGSNIHEVNWKEFGPDGSIATEQACQAADGRWIPQIFGWMVHVYPYHAEPAKVWAH
jgi:hypothetical protein